MLENERQEEILAVIKQKKYIKPKELSQTLFVSLSTIRRDLIHLEKLGLIHKHHGQVSLFENNEPAHELRQKDHHEEKNYIAKIASNYLENGKTIFLDSSTTTNALCPYINEFSNLTIITNSLKNALDLSVNTSNHVIVTGGTLKPFSVSLLGEKASSFIQEFNADLAFFSCKSFDLTGVYEEDFQQGYLKNNMISQAKIAILLSDASKLYKKNFYTFSTYASIQTIILDQKPDNKFIEMCHAHECELDW
ncbi:DeoR/GlpR family DNA-binding transcription regulator [Enterococcus sp. 5H]|uniref:DeoR/GlpR family DNA-binding transcription regulator n=1 Tax=Enterococcus sp. 5H TaxID=1229490 RepID=UPI0023043902|nr:DeoR/GlpR family DNA-binding transcription regulator [Enterococcus sp. 5H]MDA9472516.1 L-fucose operon activator [Enterococcus sp. 5H]